jgi:hypothetical protein
MNINPLEDTDEENHLFGAEALIRILEARLDLLHGRPPAAGVHRALTRLRRASTAEQLAALRKPFAELQ